MNNDLDFAIKLKDTALVNALTDKKAKKTQNGTVLNEQIITPDNKESKMVYDIEENGEGMEKATDDILLPDNESNARNLRQNNLEIYTPNIPVSSPESSDAVEMVGVPIPSKDESQTLLPSKRDAPVIYKVKKGDVLVIIAKQYNVSVTQIKQWNDLSSSRINIDQELLIYLDDSNSTSIFRRGGFNNHSY